MMGNLYYKDSGTIFTLQTNIEKNEVVEYIVNLNFNFLGVPIKYYIKEHFQFIEYIFIFHKTILVSFYFSTLSYNKIIDALLYDKAIE